MRLGLNVLGATIQVALLIFTSIAAQAGTVYLDTIPGFPNPVGGGPFMVHVVQPINEGGANYVAGATFKTFCIEFTEEFYPGSSHIYETRISDMAVFGHDTDGTANYDPLSSATAWLYRQWREGSLSGVNDNVPGNLYALQDAIWKLQNWNLSPTAGATAGLADALVALATSATASANGSLYGVRVMQLWDPGHVGQLGSQHQDQLILVPLPPASSIGFAGLAAAACMTSKRRFAV